MATIEQRVSYIEGNMGSLATKEDLARSEGVLKQDIGRLEGELKQDIARLEGRIDRLEEKVDGLANALMLRLGGVVVVVVGLGVAVLRLWE